MSLPDTHLDLGCGKFPRNPYGRTHRYGVDLRGLPSSEAFESRVANLSLEPIPYDEGSFGSVSAFDFIEHIPRVLAVDGGRQTRFPFIELMNEVWRVLAPGGRFYAVTPAFPKPEAFVDPTHVNIITKRTHEYFCGERPLARIYGFEGHFKLLRTGWVSLHDLDFTGPEKAAEREELERKRARNRQPVRWLVASLRESLRFARGKRGWRLDGDRKNRMLWEFEAVKDSKVSR
jgi:SAM-dependent methyltransferase